MYDSIKSIKDGKCVLGIEFGSTRIKAVLVDESNQVIATGSYLWENSFKNNIWTYDEDAIWTGLRECYLNLKQHVLSKYNITLSSFASIGISGMMHGYIAIDREDKLLVPFRTWRNTITERASNELSSLFNFHIPQRWTIAHIYQAILNNELHIKDIHHITTLAGYVHYKLTGSKHVGVGEASGIFPINTSTKTYNQDMMSTFNNLVKDSVPWKLQDVLPSVLVAGEVAGHLSQTGRWLLDPTGDLESGIVLCPAEGDAGTGMVATNAIKPKTGNVSAGTSIFAMIVLDKELSRTYDSIDIVTTPVGDNVAMVHVNNCTSDINAWAAFIKDTLQVFGKEITDDELYDVLFNSAFRGTLQNGNILAYHFVSGEHLLQLEKGRPMLIREPNAVFSLSNIMKANIFSSIATLRMGMDILAEESFEIDSIMAHGGLFKTPLVGQKILASALSVPVTVMETASEGGAFGMAVLANYVNHRVDYKSFSDYLDKSVFVSATTSTEDVDEALQIEFNQYLQAFVKGLNIVKEGIL